MAQPTPVNNFFTLTQEQLQDMVVQITQAQRTQQEERPKDLKLKEPSDFDGKQANARAFLLECELYLQANAHQFNTDERKILFVLSYCKTGAAHNFREYVMRMAAMPAQTGQPAQGYGTWEKFRQNFTQSFVTSDVQGEALRELRRITQTKDVDTYIQDFRMLVARAELTDQVTIEGFFRSGLKSYIKNVLKMQLTMPKQMDGDDGWYARAQTVEKNARKFENSEGARDITHAAKVDSLPPAEPMDVDTLRISREERTKRMREGRCFYCNAHGHLYSECKERPPDDKQNRQFKSRNNGGYKRSKKEQIKYLAKSMTEDERKQLAQELRGDSMTRIRVLMQDMPDEQKEEAAEQILAKDFA